MRGRIKTILCTGLLVCLLCGNLVSLADTELPEGHLSGAPSNNTENFSREYMSGPYYEKLKEVTLTGNYREDFLAIANSQIGYCEGDEDGQLDGTFAGSNDHTEYARFITGNEKAVWCSEFASWCARMANVPTYILNSSTGANAKRFGAPYYTWEETIFAGGSYEPAKGDLIIWAEPGTADPEKSLAHTSIFKEARQEEELVTLYSIDGNWGGEVGEVRSLVNASDGVKTGRSREVAFFISPNYESDGSEVTLNVDSHEMKVGEYFGLEVSNGIGNELNAVWSSSAPETVEVTNYGWIKTLKEGTAIITAKVDDISVVCVVTVIGEEKEKSLTLNYSSYEMSTAETLKLKATTEGFASAPEISWSSSDNEIVTVDKNGNVKPLKKGKAAVTASVGDVQAVCVITVVEEEENPLGLSISPSSYELFAGESVQLQVATSSNARKKQIEGVEWSSSDDKVATVDETGMVTGVEKGSARIKATIDQSSAICRITVWPKEENAKNWEKLALNFSSYELKKGNTVQLKAKASIGETEIDISPEQLQWSSSDSLIITVDKNGMATAIANGTAEISAKVNQLTAICKITVSSGSSSGSSGGGGGGSHSGGGSGGSGGGGGGSRSVGGSSSSGGPGASLPSYVEKGEWAILNGFWRFVDASGNAKVNTWTAAYNPYATAGQQNYDWFRFDANGNMLTGWFTDIDGNRYFLNPVSDGTLGKMLTGWVWIADEFGVQRCYYFNPNSDGYRGKLLTNTVIDGYTIDANGCWTVDGVVQVK